MKVNRPINVSRPEVDRGSDARKTGRSRDGQRTGDRAASVGGDRLESEVTSFIDEAVDRNKADLDARLEDVRARRDELLARANDDDAIRSAARRLLDSL